MLLSTPHMTLWKDLAHERLSSIVNGHPLVEMVHMIHWVYFSIIHYERWSGEMTEKLGILDMFGKW